MAVFAGGAFIDAVAAVGELDEYDALDLLDRLVARSMVVAVDTSLGTRFGPDTLRQYAEDRLAERAATTRVRHLDWPAAGATRHGEATASESDARRYVAEIDNLRAAVSYAVNVSRTSGVRAARRHRVLGACAGRSRFSSGSMSRIPAEEWTDAVAATAGVFAMCALFAGTRSAAENCSG
jgi:hypothetical protein